jgi:glycosyltransferase involved in cell wall biosynthesis
LFSELSGEKHAQLKDIDIIMLPCLSRRFYLPKGGFNKIKNAVRNADVIHLMSHWNYLNVVVYFYARYFNKPYVVCPAGALPVFGRSKMIKKLFNYFIGNRIIKNANGHIAVAANEFAQYKTYGVNEKQITLIPNGVTLEDFQGDVCSESENLDLPEQYILFVGRLNYIKGPDLLLEAFNKLSKTYANYHLVFAGPDGGMLAELELGVKKYSITDRVHFLGHVNGEHRLQVYKQASFLAIPSRQEAMSMVVLEAGMFAKPALITDQCGFDILQDKQGGYVVAATSGAIEQGLIDMISSLQKQVMGDNLKNFILENYTWDSVGKKIVELYETMLYSKLKINSSS